MRKLLAVFLCTLVFSVWLYAQSNPVTVITAPASSTLVNCGTPSVPSLCVVSAGVYVWQNSTQGWFLLSPSASAGVASVTVCNAAGASCGTAQTGAVSLNIPKTVTVTVGNPTASVTQGAVAATLN